MLSGQWPAALHLTARSQGRGSQQEFRPLRLGIVMSEPDLIHFHAREAARFRRLLANATTPAVKARLTEQATAHERRAERMEHSEKPAPAVSNRAMAEP